MNCSKFRTELMDTVRKFDAYAWRDSMDNPEEYIDLTFDDWFELFVTYKENMQ